MAVGRRQISIRIGELGHILVGQRPVGLPQCAADIDEKLADLGQYPITVLVGQGANPALWRTRSQGPSRTSGAPLQKSRTTLVSGASPDPCSGRTKTDMSLRSEAKGISARRSCPFARTSVPTSRAATIRDTSVGPPNPPPVGGAGAGVPVGLSIVVTFLAQISVIGDGPDRQGIDDLGGQGGVHIRLVLCSLRCQTLGDRIRCR